MAKTVREPRPLAQLGRMMYAQFLAWADEVTLAEWAPTLPRIDGAAYAAYLREQLRRAEEER